MKKILKVLMYFFLTIILLVIILTVVAKITENGIAKKVMVKVSETIDAPVDINGVSFNLLRKFPLATIELNGIYLGSPIDSINPELPSDTIANIDKIYVSVKSKALLNNRFEIIKVEMHGAKINYKVDSTGHTNIDFLTATDTTVVEEEEVEDTTASSPIDLTLKALVLKDIELNYIDSVLKASAKLTIPKFKLKAKVKGDDIKASVKGGIVLSNCSFDTTNAYLMNKTTANFNVDYENDSIHINDFVLDTDGANINALGDVVLGDVIYTNMQLNVNKLDLGELMKYAPEAMLKEFGVKNVKGLISIQTKIQGNYSDSTKEMPHVDLAINMSGGNVATTEYPEIKNLKFSGKVSNGVLRNNQSTSADIKGFHFEIGQSKFNFDVSVLDIDKPNYNLKTDVFINVLDFMQFVPDTLRPGLRGSISAKLSTKGQAPDSVTDAFIEKVLANTTASIKLNNFNARIDSSLSVKDFKIQVDYKPKWLTVKNFNITIPEYNAGLRNTSLTAKILGKYSNQKSLGIELTKFNINTDSSSISGMASVRNIMDNPTLNTRCAVNVNLAEVGTFAPDSLLDHLQGMVNVSISFNDKIYLDSIEKQMEEILFTKSNISVSMKDIGVDLANDSLVILKDFGGRISLSPKQISIDKLDGTFHDISFMLDSTIIRNVYNSVILNKKDTLFVDAVLDIGDVKYSNLLALIPADSTTVDTLNTPESNEKITSNEVRLEDSVTVDTSSTNYSVLAKGKVRVNSFRYGPALIEEISTLFKVSDSVYIADQFKFKAFGGKMNSSLKYYLEPNGETKADTKHKIEKMDIKQLLKDFDKYIPDSVISHKNISGLFSTDLYTRTVLIGDSIIMPDMRIKGDIKLENGGVYDYAPAKELSKFTRINELDNIQFKTLESSIFMFKNKMYVPETHIVSTAVDISAFGMQSMGEDFEYHLKLHLSDVLKGKSDKLIKEQTKSGRKVKEEDVERNSVNLIYSKINGKTKANFDTKKQQDKMKNKIRVQDKILSLVFYPKLFKFETGVK